MKNYFPQLGDLVLKSAFILALVLISTSVVYAAPGAPKILHYQGRLLDSNGELLGGSGTDYCFRFSLYDDATVGAPDTKLWPTGTPSDMTVNVAGGVFAVGVGDTTAGGDTLDYDFSDTDTVYLNIEVATEVGGSCGGGDESYENLSPRQRIESAAYAINSSSVLGTSQSAIGTTSAAANASLTLEATSTSGIPLVIRRFASQVSHLFDVISELGQSLFTINANGNVGIGTSTPYAKLSVVGDVVAASYVATTSATSTYTGGIQTNLLNVTATNASSTFANGIDIADGCFSIGGNCLDLSGNVSTYLDLSDTPSSYTANALVFANSSANGLTQNPGLVYASGLLGVGSTSPSYRLSVSGDAFIDGNASIANLVATGTIGIGTTSPAEQLGLSGLLYVGGNGTSTFEHNAHILGTLQVGNSSLYLTSTGINGTGDVNVNSGGNFNVNSGRLFVDGTTGYVGIGSSSPYVPLAVEGEIVAGSITATSTQTSVFNGDISTDLIAVSSTTATSSFANGVRLTGGCFEDQNGTCLQQSQDVIGVFRNASGGGNLDAATATSVPWDTEDQKDTGITHPVSNDPSRIQLDDAGWYRISYTIIGRNTVTSAARGSVECRMRVNGSVSDSNPSQSYTYSRGQYSQYVSNSATFLYNAGANDYIQIYCSTSPSSDQSPTIQLVSNQSWISIEKVGGSLGSGGGSGSGSLGVKEGGSTVVNSASSLDFTAGDFDVSNPGGGTAGVAIDYTNSGIARKGQNETVTGLWSFSNLLSLGQASSTRQSITDRLYIGGTATTTIVGDNSTSTFAGGIQTSALDITATNASSTFANGIVLSGGCVLVNNTCLSSASSYTDLTDTPSSLTANAIPFVNSGGTALTQTSTFVYDATNGRLGIGEASPEGLLDLYSNVYSDLFVESATNTNNGSDFVFRKSRLGGGALSGDEVGGIKFDVFDGLSYNRAAAIDVMTEGTILVGQTPSSIRFSTNGLSGNYAEQMRITPDGNLGIGTTSPAARFTVEGNSFLSGNVTATGTVTANLLSVTATNASSTFANGIDITDGCFSVNSICLGGSSVDVLGDLSDVDTSGVSYGSVLAYNGSGWADTATSALAIALTDTTGTLAADRGGTGLSTLTSNQLLIGGAGDTVTQIATSSLNINTGDLTEGSNLFYTATRVNNLILASSTIVDLKCPTGYVAKADGVGGWNCQPDLVGSGGGGGGSGFWATTSDSLVQYPDDPTRVVVVGGSATTTTGNIFEVIGSSLFDNVSIGGTLNVTGHTVLGNASSTLATASNGFYAGTSNPTVIRGDSSTSTFANGIDVASGCVAVNGTCIVSATDVTFGTLSDTSFSSLAYGNLVIYNGANWVNAATSTLGIALTDTTGTLSVSRGGTGATSFSSGGFLFGNGASAVGASSSPTIGWITATSTTATSTFANGISLTSGCVTVSGNCLTSNKSYLGLTDTPSSFTANAVQYANAGATALAQTATFVYDAVNGRLGIGTANPEGVLHTSSSVNGDVIFHSSTSTPNATNIELRKSRGAGSITSGDSLGSIIFNGFDALSYDTGARIDVVTEGTTQVGQTPSSIRFSTDSLSGSFGERMRITPNGNIGIGTSSPYEMLSVAGGIVANYLSATSSATSTFAGGVQTNLLNIVSTNASSTFANGIIVENGCVTVNGTCLSSNSTYQSLTDTPVSLTPNAIQYADSGGTSLAQSSSFTFNGTTLSVNNLSITGSSATSTFAGGVDVSGGIDVAGRASTSDLYINDRIDGAGLTSCNGADDKLGWDSSTGKFSCGTDQGTDQSFDAYDSAGGVALQVGTQVTLTLDATTTQGSAFDLTNNVVTILEDGTYMFIAHLTVTNPDLTGAARAAMILNAQASTSPSGFVNLPNGICRDYVRENANDLGASCTISWIATSTVGDQYRLQHSKGDTTTMNTLAGGSGFTIVKLSDQTTGGADLAEVYYAKDRTLSSGDIVAVDDTSPVGVTRSDEVYQGDMLGIVTTHPGLVIGDTEKMTDRQSVGVALTGRVPMKVDIEGGEIRPGDPITSSSISGIGMKAAHPGEVIGTALEGYTAAEAEADAEAGIPTKIMVFVNPHWYGGDQEQFVDWLSLDAASGTPETASGTTTGEGSLSGIRKLVYDVLDTFGLVIKKGALTLNHLFADTITVDNAGIRNAVLASAHIGNLSVEQSFEMVDQETGATYCMVLRDGALTPVAGACGKGAAAASNSISGGAATTQSSGLPAEVSAQAGTPVITILGNNPAELNVGDTYTDLGVTVKDDHDENIGVSLFVDGTSTRQVVIDTSVPGEHVVSYRVTDTDGNSSEAERTIIVGASDTAGNDVADEDVATDTADVASTTPPTTSVAEEQDGGQQTTPEETNTATATSSEPVQAGGSVGTEDAVQTSVTSEATASDAEPSTNTDVSGLNGTTTESTAS